MPPILSESMHLRLFVFAMCFFTQGLPSGMTSIGLGPWLLASGCTTERVSALSALVNLPWGLKVVIAPLVDSPICGRKFGLRRPWIVFGQFGLLVSLVLLGIATYGAGIDETLQLLAVLGVIYTSFNALTSVAVETMAIDLLPHGEKARTNAAMTAGWTVGDAMMGSLSGALLPMIHLSGVATFCALLVLPSLVLMICVIERPSEPENSSSNGASSSSSSSHAEDAPLLTRLTSLLYGLLFNKASVLVLVSMIFAQTAYGASGTVNSRLLLTKGLSSGETSTFYSIASIVCGAFGVLIWPLVDRYGARRFFAFTIGIQALSYVAIYSYGSAMTATHIIVLDLIKWLTQTANWVAFATFCMRLSTSLAVATQYAALMAVRNSCTIMGDALVATGLVATPVGWFGVFAALSSIGCVVAIAIPDIGDDGKPKPQVLL